MIKYLVSGLIGLLWLVHTDAVKAALTLPPLFSDHMVLQRDMLIPVWGSAHPAEKVTVYLGDEHKQILSDKSGRWSVALPAMKAGGPYILTVSTQNESIVLQDVMVGEVWLCSGQSNMEFPLQSAESAEKAISKANDPAIRLFRMEKRVSMGNVAFTEEEIKKVNAGELFLTAKWQLCTLEAAQDFSAVAYFFGQMLYDSLRVPIGLIQNAVGGSPIQSWVSREVLAAHPQLSCFVKPVEGKTWMDLDNINPWLAQRARQNLKLWFEQGEKGSLPSHPFAPSYLFDSGIQSIVPYGIRGIIWYQGESNATHPDSHSLLFSAMVENWRTTWGQGDFPFLFVQLPGIGGRNRWPEFRESQSKALSIPNTGMAVTIDAGDPQDVHPKKKNVVGQRLGRVALAQVYGHSIVYSGPVLTHYQQDKDTFILTFEHAEGLKTSDGGPVQGFTMQGYTEAGQQEIMVNVSEAAIAGNEIVLTIPENLSPTTIKYGWAPDPVCNLVNSADLPASPFRIGLPGNN